MIQPLKNQAHKTIINGLILTVVLLICWSLSSRFLLHDFSKATQVLVSRITFWLYTGAIYLYAIRKEKQTFLLWADKHYKTGNYILHIILIFLVILFISGICFFILKCFGLLKMSEDVIRLRKLNAPLKVFIAITAGVAEELIFRGYMMTRLCILFKNKHLPIFISAIIFGVAHIWYGTLVNVLYPAIIGIVFGYHYYKYRNLKMLIICHFLIDLNALFNPALKH
ncbi:lysostaphin resistance A-like protein [Mucilaginibacter sp. RCC_168]|uniref:CPBP family intramembrane glutamic endopeptidase n=1 Tax=Mucilaginibacter sp. RCC_168 TaxID=3239221 RepID=UPI0035256D99